jgi:hypothetical protein
LLYTYIDKSHFKGIFAFAKDWLERFPSNFSSHANFPVESDHCVAGVTLEIALLSARHAGDIAVLRSFQRKATGFVVLRVFR